jgi:hypothetical protein
MRSHSLEEIRHCFSRSTDFKIAYDVFLWLASVFEVTASSDDNYELALHYYQKAAEQKPERAEPYLDACDCYDPDLNIPPVVNLIEFVRKGVQHVSDPIPLFRRLAHLYDSSGDRDKSEYYRRRAEGGGGEPPAE